MTVKIHPNSRERRVKRQKELTVLWFKNGGWELFATTFFRKTANDYSRRLISAGYQVKVFRDA